LADELDFLSFLISYFISILVMMAMHGLGENRQLSRDWLQCDKCWMDSDTAKLSLDSETDEYPPVLYCTVLPVVNVIPHDCFGPSFSALGSTPCFLSTNVTLPVDVLVT
jgi:hypothetical protein